MIDKTPRTRRNVSGADRGDGTRERLLTAAIDVFGRYGFDGATTRALADAAGVNLQAIPYHFGGKEGLYVAAAEHIAQSIGARIAGLRERVRARLEDADPAQGGVGVAEARTLLAELLQAMATVLVSRESETWARFLIREQMEPTEAFRRVYHGVMGPTLAVIGRLVATILDDDPRSEHVRLRTLSLVGGVIVFRTAHAAALAQLGWTEIGPREVEVVRGLARELAASLVPPGPQP